MWKLMFLAVAAPLWAQLDPLLPIPPGNPLTAEKVALGRKLFFDGRLSADGSVSCSTCHDPKHAFADDRPLSIGIHQRQGPRHTPSLIARGYGSLQFCDGRSESLDKQVIEPIRNSKEMDTSVEPVVGRLSSDPAYP